MQSDVLREEQQKIDEQRKQTEIRRNQLLSDYKDTFLTAHGKRVLWDLLERCHLFRTTFTGNSKGMFFEGERNVGLYLLTMNELCSLHGLEQIKNLRNEE